MEDAWGACLALSRWGDSSKAAFHAFLYIIPLLALDAIACRTKICAWLPTRAVLFWTTIWAGIALALICGQFEGADFVYFQF